MGVTSTKLYEYTNLWFVVRNFSYNNNTQGWFPKLELGQNMVFSENNLYANWLNIYYYFEHARHEA